MSRGHELESRKEYRVMSDGRTRVGNITEVQGTYKTTEGVNIKVGVEVLVEV